MSTPPVLVIDPNLFASFQRWSGTVPADHWASWLGVLTPTSVFAFTDELLKYFDHEREQTPPYPVHDEQVLDYVPMLEAVLDAPAKFVMVALGAGWGRWLTAGAYAARNKGKTYQLVGVEAEPEHFRWLQQHFQQAGIAPGSYRLINAAASGTNGDCWFYVGKPAAWYGQSLVPDRAVDGLGGAPHKVPLGSERDHNGEKIKRMHSVDLAEVLRGLPLVDYLHMDIQGTEYQFLAAHPRLLQAQVKMVNIGTHAHEIEADLRVLFQGLGWVKRFDLPLNTRAVVQFEQQSHNVTFGDGVQVWLNPRYSHGLARKNAAA